jgi:hypothetical protein
LGKKTGQICLREKPSVSDLESGSLAGFFALIRSNLCTRHIPDKLTPRGHHDWPDKGVFRQADVTAGWPTKATYRYQPGDDAQDLLRQLMELAQAVAVR